MRIRQINPKFYMRCGCVECRDMRITKRRYGKSIRSVKQDEAARMDLKYKI